MWFFHFLICLPCPLSAMKSMALIGITIKPTIRSATARLMMNMLDTVCNLFSVLMACSTMPFPTAVTMLSTTSASPASSRLG